MNKRFVLFIIFLFSILFTLAALFLSSSFRLQPLSPLSPTPRAIEKPLMKYSFASLSKRVFTGSEITISEILKDGPGFTSYLFSFLSDGKKVSGLLNIPKEGGISPVLILLRGYVDREIYETGTGTNRTGEAFAQNGFITLAPDFLGYGESASASSHPLEERFQTYTTVAQLVSSVKNLNSAFRQKQILNLTADTDHIGIWGHSNGGHIALSLLAITGGTYPTVLWAPVTKPFPYSIFYYTDEYEDHGKMLRKLISDFEKDYDIEEFSPPNYFSQIQAPLQIHQGTEDESVPKKWSDQFVSTVKGLGGKITSFTYPGENHNFNLGSWPLALSRSVSFFQTEFARK